jgi:GLPGLI family protein
MSFRFPSLRVPALILPLFAALLFTGSTGCSGGFFKDKTTEGTIEYDVTYPGIGADNMMAAGLPDKATYKFKKESSITEFSGMMGLIRIAYIADGDKKSAHQTLNLIDQKYDSELNTAQINEVNKEFVKDAKPVSGSKEIAGYKCKKAEITLSDGTKIEAWYTTDLGMENINWCNPYFQIKGVMMEFQMQKYNVTMKLVAKTVTKDAVNDADFTIPTDYKKITIKEQNKILEDLNPVK